MRGKILFINATSFVSSGVNGISGSFELLPCRFRYRHAFIRREIKGSYPDPTNLTSLAPVGKKGKEDLSCEIN